MQVVADPAAVLQTCLSWTHPLLREGKGQDDTALCLGDFSSSPLGHGRSQTATSRAAQLPPISANMNSKRSLNRCFGGREDLPSPQRLAQLQMIFVSKLSVIPHAGRSAVLLSPVMPWGSNGGLSLKLHSWKRCERGEPAPAAPAPTACPRPFPESHQLLCLMGKTGIFILMAWRTCWQINSREPTCSARKGQG